MPLLDIDVQGAFKFEKAFPKSNFCAFLPPSIETIANRLKSRGTETEETMNRRIKNATGEIEQLAEAKNLFKYRIINDDLSLAKDTMV